MACPALTSLVLGRISSCSIFVDAILVELPAGGRGRQVRAGLRRRPQHLCERRHQPHPGGMPSVVDFVVHGGGGGPSMDGPTLHSAQSHHGGIPPAPQQCSAGYATKEKKRTFKGFNQGTVQWWEPKYCVAELGACHVAQLYFANGTWCMHHQPLECLAECLM